MQLSYAQQQARLANQQALALARARAQVRRINTTLREANELALSEQRRLAVEGLMQLQRVPQPVLPQVHAFQNKFSLHFPSYSSHFLTCFPFKKMDVADLLDSAPTVLESRVFARDGRNHPIQDISILEGPSRVNLSRGLKWLFRVRIDNSYRLTLHESDPNSMRERNVRGVYEIFQSVLHQCLLDGARKSDYIHIYMQCEGMDHQFVFNPCGDRATKIGDLLDGDRLKEVIESFSKIIQSGKNVYLNNSTIIRAYTFRPPSGGAKYVKNSPWSNKKYKKFQNTAEEDVLIHNSRSIVNIVNDENDQTCFCKAFVLGLKRLRDTETYTYWMQHKTRPSVKKAWREEYINLHMDTLNLSPNERLEIKHYNLLAELHNVNIHIWEGHGYQPEFSYHSPQLGFEEHLYFYLGGEHFHLITNIQPVITNFRRNQDTHFCESCYQIYKNDHECPGLYMADQDDDDNVNGEEPVFSMGKRKWTFDPIEGHKDETREFIKRTEPPKKKATDRKVLYLDFETYVKGKAREEDGEEEPMRIDPVLNHWPESYQPYPFHKREFDTSKYEYLMEVNYCEIQDDEGSVHTFKTLNAVMEFLCQPFCHKAIVIAHCGGIFDFQFLYNAFITGFHLKKARPPLMKGNKIMKAEIVNEITLLDSYNFVAHALAKFPEIFDIQELKKGFFPHLFNLPEFWNYKGPIPDKEYYDPDRMNTKKRDEFLKWHEKMVKSQHLFDFEKEMIEYCHSDVELLKVGMQKFRKEFMELTDETGRPIGVDPFDYGTIAAVSFNGVYCQHFLPPDTIAVVPRPSADNYSHKSIVWLEYVASQQEINIQHACNGGEVWITIGPQKRKVDGFCADTNTIFQFHGCFWHGCPKCFKMEETCKHSFYTARNKKGKMEKKYLKFGNVYQNTLRITEEYVRLGYHVEEMWECDFDKIAKKENLRLSREDLEYMRALIPRDAYFGGRTNAAKLYYKCTGPEKIHYMDITSMYPHVMSDPQYYFPTGFPTILRKGRNQLLPIDEVFGLIKCIVEPPKDLYFPVLPDRLPNGKVVFHLNRMLGTWTSVEVQRAVKLRYRVVDVLEQHHFYEKSNTLFKSYNDTFFAIKREAKLAGNKGREAIAKMCINGPTGKWGYNPSKERACKVIRDSAELFSLFIGSYEKLNMNFINGDVCMVKSEESSEYTEHSRSNVYISAFITAYSRDKLYAEALQPLNRSVLYFDTDSVIYVSPTGDHLIPVDTTGAMGLWTSEAKDGDWFTEFVSAGPKTYALRSHSGEKNIAKSKGFSLHFNNSQIFNLESLREKVMYKSLHAKFTKMCLHKGESLLRREDLQVTVHENRGKILNMDYDKREILYYKPDTPNHLITMVDTLPHGHEDIQLHKDGITMYDSSYYWGDDDEGVEETKGNW